MFLRVNGFSFCSSVPENGNQMLVGHRGPDVAGEGRPAAQQSPNLLSLIWRTCKWER